MPTRMDLELLKGAIDIHVHSAPSLFHRHCLDDIVQNAHMLGIKAMVLKNHHSNTLDRAVYASKLVPGMDIFGGVTLNYAVGGINPFAVDTALRSGAKQVWFPTIDSVKQKHHYGSLGGYGTTQSFKLPEFYLKSEGISILNNNGELTFETQEVVHLVADANAILAVGHLTYAEIKMLVKYAVNAGLRKIVVDHPHLSLLGLTLEEQQELVALGAYMNYCFSEITPKWFSVNVSNMIRHMRTIGPNNIVLSSDLGQVHNPLPTEGLRIFVQVLLEGGIAPEDIDIMLKKNPGKLLYE